MQTTMELITKYKAKDGREFSTPEECVKHEDLIYRVNKIMDALPKKPVNDGCSFANGGGFIQHDKSILKSVKINLLKLMKEYINHKWIDQTIEDEKIHPSWVERLIEDYRIYPFMVWSRFTCIDSQGREWGQPYYANHPSEGKQICLNP